MIRNYLVQLGTVAAAVIATAGLYVHVEQPFYQPEPTLGEEAFDYACEALQVNCTTLDAPEIQFAPTMGPYGWYYPGENVVYIAEHFRGDFEDGTIYDDQNLLLDATVIHETVHYIDSHLNVTGDLTAPPYCDAEALAWAVDNIYMIQQGGETVWGWHQNYGCF